MPIDTLNIDGQQVVYQIDGDPNNPAMIFIHGWNSYRGMWADTIAFLCNDYYCVSIDLLGYGESSKPTQADFSIDAQAKRVLAVADALEIRQFALMGHSMGGLISVYITIRLAPERVTWLVDVAGIVSGKPRRGVMLMSPIITLSYYAPVLVWLARQVTRIPMFGKLGFRFLFHRMNSVPYAEWAGDRRVSVQARSHIASYWGLKALQAVDLRDELAQINVPTLVIFGTQDNLVSLDDGEIMGNQIEDCWLVVFDECGHYPMYEKKQAYFEVLRKFLVSPEFVVIEAE